MAHRKDIPRPRNRLGFTLIEMMAAVTLAVLVMSMVWTAFRLQSGVTRTMSDASKGLESVQRLLFRLEDLVGKAGLDPLDYGSSEPSGGPPRFGVIRGEARELEFSFDEDRDGELDPQREHWKLWYDEELMLTAREGEAQRMTPNVRSFRMEYLCNVDADGEDNNGDGTSDEMGEWEAADSAGQGGDCPSGDVLAIRFDFSILLSLPNDPDEEPIERAFTHTVRLWNQPK